MRKLFSLLDVAGRIAGDVAGGTAPTSAASDTAVSSRAGARQSHELPPSRCSAECGQPSRRNVAALPLAIIAFAIGGVPASAEQYYFARSRVEGLATGLSAGKSKQHILNDLNDISEGAGPRVGPAWRAREVETASNDFRKVLAPLVESPTALASPNTPLEIAIFAQKADAAWDVLQGRFANRVSDAEIDHLFACFVLGLTSPAYAEGEPALHFDVCRALVAVKLPPERVHAALHTVPEPTQPWLASACALIESQGAKIARALQEKTSNLEDFSTAKANAATGSLGNNEENLQ
jgi:hypothetical protein